MSHEIRTPMTAILGLGYLLERTELTPVQRDYIDKIGAATRSLQAIVHDILDFSKIESGFLELERVTFDLDEVLDELACVAGVAAEGKAIEINFVVAPTLPRVLVGDPLRLEQVLSNLLGNAIKFTLEGEVRLEIDLDATVDTGGVAEAVGLRFSVIDTGIGIDDDALGKLFEAFSQADASTTRRFGGTGLGLAICRRLVDLMGGRISVDSKPGVGSRFSFSLLFGTEPEAAAPAASGAGTVIVAVRHPTTRANLAALLATAGYEAQPAESAAAVARLIDTDMAPHAVLADSEWLGEAPLAAIVADAVIPVLRLSSDWVHAADRERQVPELAGHVLKPVTRNALCDALNPVSSRPPPASPTPRLAGLRILVVEDSAVNRQVVSEILTCFGALAECAGDGAAALSRLRGGAAFDVVLMDLQMPEMDGFEAVRQMRCDPALARLPVIALTANVLKATVERCRNAGMAMHLAKPVDPEDLCQAILRILGRNPGNTGEIVLPAADPLFDGALPGIDLAEARIRMLGDAGRLRRMLGAFADGYGGYAAAIGEALACGDFGRAARLAHDLVGAAATVGATGLASAARALERTLATATESVPSTAGDLHGALARELACVLATARELNLEVV